MSMQDVVTKVGKGENASAPVTVQYDFGDTLEEAVELYGADVVFSHYLANAKIAVQGRVRTEMLADMAAGREPDEKRIAEVIKGYKLGSKVPRKPKDKVEQAHALLQKLSKEERERVLKLSAKLV